MIPAFNLIEIFYTLIEHLNTLIEQSLPSDSQTALHVNDIPCKKALQKHQAEYPELGTHNFNKLSQEDAYQKHITHFSLM